MKQLQLIQRLTLSLCFILAIAWTSNAQSKDKSSRPSPPATASATINGVAITIDYSQPAVKGRKLWDGLVPYGKVWRTGANEASWIEVSEDVTIAGKKLPKGKYGLFTIPGENEWTIIFNETWSQWGAYEYDSEKDVLRVTTKPSKTDEFYERFTIELDKSGKASMNWGNLSIPFDIKK